MDKLPRPIDPATLKKMAHLPEFSGKSLAELACLITTGFDILEDQNHASKGKKVKAAHYHLPLNHVEAKRAVEGYLRLSVPNPLSLH